MSKLRKIVHLQTLRALSASVVVATHALEYPIRRHILGEDLYRLAWGIGWTGVASFFMISGLIMIRSGHADFNSVSNARKFAINRLIRVVPLYWLAVIPFSIATALRHEPLTAVMFLKTLFFVPYLSSAEHAMRPIVGQGWTLNYEMIFYALFSICLLLPRRIGLPALLLAFPIVVLARCFVWPLSPYHDATTALQFLSDPVTLFFVIGMLIGLAELRARTWHGVHHPLAWTVLSLTITVSVFILGGGSFPMPIGWQAFYALYGTISLILCTSKSDHHYPKLARITEAAGDASYSTYLVHPLILMVLATAWDRLPIHAQSPVIFVLLALLVCNIAGYGCYRAIERPLSKWLRGGLTTRPALDAPPASVTA